MIETLLNGFLGIVLGVIVLLCVFWLSQKRSERKKLVKFKTHKWNGL